MQSFDVPVSEDGSLILPKEALSLLKVKNRKRVTLFLEGGVVHILPGPIPIEEAKGALGSLDVSADLDIEIEDAIDEALREKYG